MLGHTEESKAVVDVGDNLVMRVGAAAPEIFLGLFEQSAFPLCERARTVSARFAAEMPVPEST